MAIKCTYAVTQHPVARTNSAFKYRALLIDKAWTSQIASFRKLSWHLYEHTRLYNLLGELCKWAQPSGAWAVQPGRLYKSLFTENSVATQKQYSTSINTNKIQNKTSLGWRAQQGGCVDSRWCGAFDENFNKKDYVGKVGFLWSVECNERKVTWWGRRRVTASPTLWRRG